MVSNVSTKRQSPHSYPAPSGSLLPGFERACTICADMSQLAKTLKPRSGPDGTFFKARYQVGITFGGTEPKAFVQWKENVRILGIAPPFHGMRWCAWPSLTP
jgi:hypothetical protein